MTEEDFGGVIVDICKDGCKSLWFDWLELIKLDENNEGFGDALNQALNYPRVNDKSRRRLNCLKCGIQMHAHKYKSLKEVNVDECFSCGGLFLDSGELSAIRENFMTEQEENAYRHKFQLDIPEFITSNTIQDNRKILLENKQRNNAISRLVRFFARGKIK
jgi:Zn-finger nucleic acid-binding protein